MRNIGGLCSAALLSPFHFSKTSRNLLCLLALLLFLPSLVFAQADTGTIAGTVRDTTGAVVPDAMVTIRNTATGAQRGTQTGSDGVYTFPGLAPALYDITAGKTGFADYKTQATVTVGSHITVDVPLSVSQVSTTVEVVAAPAAEINTQTQEVSQIVTPGKPMESHFLVHPLDPHFGGGMYHSGRSWALSSAGVPGTTEV